jgi:hypothetical protein
MGTLSRFKVFGAADKRNWRVGLFPVVGWVGMPGLAVTPRHPKLE